MSGMEMESLKDGEDPGAGHVATEGDAEEVHEHVKELHNNVASRA
jgi:hypothetical protein